VTFEDGLTSYDGAGGEAAADERWEGGFDPSHSLRGWKGKRVLDIRDVVEDVWSNHDLQCLEKQVLISAADCCFVGTGASGGNRGQDQ
jgi:hypothetical protein